jgi:hypothetical protein
VTKPDLHWQDELPSWPPVSRVELHKWQRSEPTPLLNLPLSQAVHEPRAAVPLNVPLGHTEQVVLSNEANVPTVQGEQKPEPGDELTKPGSQSRHPNTSGAPVIVYLPIVQFKHTLLAEWK